MKYIVTLSTEAVVEGKNKHIAARKAALFLAKALAGKEPENCEGRKAERVYFYCSPDEYQGGMEGQGENDADISSATLNAIHHNEIEKLQAEVERWKELAQR